MYSGTTLTRYSGRVLGAHQKIDRVSRRQLRRLISDNRAFPAARSILQFEGKNGPDGIKRKSPAHNEPWHYFDPYNPKEGDLLPLLQSHYARLVKELRGGNRERSAFEAAWLAHAIVDGLTPAHHYPYEEKLVELRGGQSKETRTTIKNKLVMPGSNRRERVRNNWQVWGPGGLITSHGLFELGIAAILMPATMSEARPTQQQVKAITKDGLADFFCEQAREVAGLKMFERYKKYGWTPRLAWQVRHKLGPILVKTVTLAWYAAMRDAKLTEKK